MSSEAAGIAIRARALSKNYLLYDKPHHRLLQSLWRGRRRYYREFQALHDVGFELAAGETLGIIGRNGAGKSTLLQLVCGTLQPSAGEVEVRGRIAALLELGTGFNPDFSGRENALINAAILGLSAEEAAARLDDILAFADIGDFIDQPVKTYSSGMYVRLAFAVVIHVSPDILIVDEALAVGDALFQAKCMTRMRRMLDNGLTLLFISHDIAAVKALCQRCLWLEHGRVRALGPTAEITRAYDQDWIREANAAQGVPADSADVVAEGHTGSGAVRLLAHEWMADGGAGARVRAIHGQLLALRLRLGVVRDCSRLVVSFHLKNRQNQHVLGGHTADRPELHARSWQAGDVFEVEFAIPIHLHHGAYALTVVVSDIGDVERYTDAAFHLWADDIAMVEVLPRARFPLSDLVEPPVAATVQSDVPRWVILDDFFPNLLTGFRVAEYNAHLDVFPGLEVRSCVADFAAEHAAYARQYPGHAARVRPYAASWLAGCRLAYLNFLNNAVHFLPDLEAHRLPFVLTLYPGGGFGLHEPDSDRKLQRVLASPLLQAVIATQPVTADYLRDFAVRHGLRLPPLHLIPGVVVSPRYFLAPPAARIPHPTRSGQGVDICFVAERYMPLAANKGYPEFIEAVGLLADQADLRFHIVGGGYSADELDFGHLADRVLYHGRLDTAALQRFYAGMDLIVSPNRPGLLHAGNFDGFPTGCCVEAALCGVAMLVTDPLQQNPGYADGQELFLLDHRDGAEPLAAQIACTVRELAADPQRLARVAQAGAMLTRRLYHPREQIEQRQRVLEAVAERLAAQEAGQ